MNFRFVDAIPNSLSKDTLYVSIKYKTMIHLCVCGCQSEVVTPISPTDWKFEFNGSAISVYPSIGNWQLKCRSHYWIKNGRIVWAEDWDDERVFRARQANEKKKENYKKRSQFPKYI